MEIKKCNSCGNFHDTEKMYCKQCMMKYSRVGKKINSYLENEGISLKEDGYENYLDSIMANVEASYQDIENSLNILLNE